MSKKTAWLTQEDEEGSQAFLEPPIASTHLHQQVKFTLDSGALGGCRSSLMRGSLQPTHPRVPRTRRLRRQRKPQWLATITLSPLRSFTLQRRRSGKWVTYFHVASATARTCKLSFINIFDHCILQAPSRRGDKLETLLTMGVTVAKRADYFLWLSLLKPYLQHLN